MNDANFILGNNEAQPILISNNGQNSSTERAKSGPKKIKKVASKNGSNIKKEDGSLLL